MRWVLVVGVGLLGCGGGSSAETFTLGDVQVDVSGEGALRVQTAGRAVFSTSASPLARSFDATTDFAWGFFRFRRRNESEAAFRFQEATSDGTSATLSYEGDAGALSVTVTPSAESTDIVFAYDGPEALDSLALPLTCDADASFLGFGAQYELTNQRGEVFDLWVREQGVGRRGGPAWTVSGDRHHSYFPVPYFMDARGYGLVVDSDERTLVDLCATDPEIAWVEVENVRELRLRVLHGPTPRDVVRQLGDQYGRPEQPAEWAWGPWIGIQGGQDVVLAEADALEAADVPYTALWAQDWVGRQDITETFIDIVYHWVVDETLYPDLRGLVDELHRRDKHFLGYINPFVIEEREHFAPMQDAGLLIQSPEGGSYVFPTFKGDSSLPDLTNPDSAAFVRDFMVSMLDDFDMDGWMADFGETLPPDAILSSGASAREEHNRYPLRWQTLNHELLRERRGNDYATFSRSGWLGSQGTAQIVWLGDQEADFEVFDGLPTVVPALINLGLSGVPYVTHDIAGYSGGPSTKELFLRWTELGAFTPVMRTHEGLQALNNWSWNRDDETIAHFRRFGRIHEALLPEITAAAEEAARSSLPIVRHLLLAYPNDPNVIDLDDQYMFGDDLLVAPVLTEENAREVYLPEGEWFHVFTGERFEGGQTLTVDAPIGTPPVFSLGRDRADLRAIE
ncbi:MAG: TIM-barrel domain-containing protein [Myxococcota bacterium]